MFLGEYSHQLDTKNRIRIPSMFKSELGNSYVFCFGAREDTIYVYPKTVMEERVKVVHKLFNDFDPDEAKMFSDFLSGIYSAEEDNQGRVLICEELRKKAGLLKDVVTIGVDDHLEIVSKETRDAQKQARKYSDVMKVVAAKMKNNGI